MTRQSLKTREPAAPGPVRWWAPPFKPHEPHPIDLQLLALLSQRERQVLIGIAQGFTNREIAERFAISSKTVDTHRGHVMKKLKLRNNSDATRFAIRVGLIGLGGPP
jgi:DNA-binding NarL/FixJ family response regulator